ncbi:MAG: pirin family protein [Magnetococcales bacterium]|nr:pirin family protein [Magnetococcales bacterium]
MTRIIYRNDLPLGGFAGIVETRMVMSPLIWPDASQRNDISHGLDDLVYLASGYFKPNDGAPIHPHNDVDIVTVVINGAVGHKGTLGDGSIIEGPGVQVQRAGSGMQHSEFSINDSQADFVQIWFQPPETGLTPSYKNFQLKDGKLTTVLGGSNDGSFHSNMVCKVGFISKGQSIQTDQPFVAIIFQGSATANGKAVKTGDLIEGEGLELFSDEGFGLVLIQSNYTRIPQVSA